VLSKSLLLFINLGINVSNVVVLVLGHSAFALLKNQLYCRDLICDILKLLLKDLKLGIKALIFLRPELLESHVHLFEPLFVVNDVILLVFAHLE
jgi:hypothetical protein